MPATTQADVSVAADDLPEAWARDWAAAVRRIDQAGYGESVARAYRGSGPGIAATCGPAAAIALGPAVSEMAIRSGKHAASLLPPAASRAAARFEDGAAFATWLRAVGLVARSARESAVALLQQSDRLLETLDAPGFEAFVRAGISVGHRDAERRRAFFTLASPEALRLVDRKAQEAGFPALKRRLGHYLTAIWGIRPPIRETPGDAPEQMRRRAGFGNGVIRMPATFAGFEGEALKAVYDAAIAHIGAHHRFTRKVFRVGKLKPVQVAMVSLVEDARVEQLAMREMPGLGALWRPFHVAKPSGTPLAIALMARLSRALIDPDYRDPDAWVGKGRALFEAAMAETPLDTAMSRRIGGLLGNDLGQMRLQFDANGYVVQPAYRDDNLGIWDVDDDAQTSLEAEQPEQGARIERQESDEGEPEEAEAEPEHSSALSREPEQPEDAVSTTRYPEYDYLSASDRPDWCAVREYPPVTASPEAIRRMVHERADLVTRLTALIRSSKVSRHQRIGRQQEGEFLDIDACVDTLIMLRTGETPDPRVYGRHERRGRDLSVLLLLDASKSTEEAVGEVGRSILDTERLATALMAHAMSELGDPFAVAAFRSDTREDVQYLRLKSFSEAWDGQAEARLAGLDSSLSTRLGAAIRHAGRDLRDRSSYRRLLLVVTDGEPSDIDTDDPRHLVEDARAAVQSLNRDGIDVFCVALSPDKDASVQRIFGRRNAVQIDSIERLPDRLPMLYLRLTA